MKRLLTLALSLLFCLLLTINAVTADSSPDASANLPPDASADDTSMATESSRADYLSQLIDDGRYTYTDANRPSRRTFNSLTDSDIIGDERQFVTIMKVDPEADSLHFEHPSAQSFQPYDKLTPVNLWPYDTYCVSIYYHNDCLPGSQEGSANINGACVAIDFPSSVTTDETDSVILATISAENAKPTSISSLVRLAAADCDVNLHIIDNSVIIHNSGQIDGSSLPDELFSEEGTKIGYNYLNGVIPGNNFGYISFMFEVIPVDPSIYSVRDTSEPLDAVPVEQSNPAGEMRVFFGLRVCDMVPLGCGVLCMVVVIGLACSHCAQKKSNSDEGESSAEDISTEGDPFEE